MDKIDLIIDALESAHHTNDTGVMGLTKSRLDEALASARELRELKPVAWMMPDYGDVLSASEADGTGIYNIPLYTAPPRKEWVGLTNDEINDFSAGCHLGKSVQSAIYQAAAKLKEKNT